MQQQLRLNAVDPGRLLERFDHVRQQPFLHGIAALRRLLGVHKQIADHAFAAFVHKEGVAQHALAFHRGVAWQNARIHVAQDHLRRAAVIPGKLPRPGVRFLIQQPAQVRRAEVAQVQDFHGCLV